MWRLRPSWIHNYILHHVHVFSSYRFLCTVIISRVEMKTVCLHVVELYEQKSYYCSYVAVWYLFSYLRVNSHWEVTMIMAMSLSTKLNNLNHSKLWFVIADICTIFLMSYHAEFLAFESRSFLSVLIAVNGQFGQICKHSSILFSDTAATFLVQSLQSDLGYALYILS